MAAKSNRKNTVLWLLQDGAECVDVHAVDGQRRNAIHLAALDPQCQYTIEVHVLVHVHVHTCMYMCL